MALCKKCGKRTKKENAKYCSLNCYHKAMGRKNYEKLIAWYKKHPGFNNMKNPEIAIKSAKNRMKNKMIWLPKLSKALKGNKNSYGCIRSEETKKILSEQKIGNKSRLGKKWSIAKKKQISKSNKITSEKLIREGKHTLQRLPRVTYSEDKFYNMHTYLQRQFGIKRWLADFYDKETNTVIEIDGSMHYKKDRIKYDKFRDKTMKQMGYNVIRIPAKEVLTNNFVEWRSR